MTSAAMSSIACQALTAINRTQRPTVEMLDFQESILNAAITAWDAGYHWSLSIFAVAIRPIVQDVAVEHCRTTGSMLDGGYVLKITDAIQNTLLTSEGPLPRSERKYGGGRREAAPHLLRDPAPAAIVGDVPQPSPAKRYLAASDEENAATSRPLKRRKPGGNGPNGSTLVKKASGGKSKKRKKSPSAKSLPRTIPCTWPDGCDWKGKLKRRLVEHLHDFHGDENPRLFRSKLAIIRLRAFICAAKILEERPAYRARRDALIRIADSLAARHESWACPEELVPLKLEGEEEERLQGTRGPEGEAGDDPHLLKTSQVREALVHIRVENGLAPAVVALFGENARLGVRCKELERWMLENEYEAGVVRSLRPSVVPSALMEWQGDVVEQDEAEKGVNGENNDDVDDNETSSDEEDDGEDDDEEDGEGESDEDDSPEQADFHVGSHLALIQDDDDGLMVPKREPVDTEEEEDVVAEDDEDDSSDNEDEDEDESETESDSEDADIGSVEVKADS